MSKRVKITKFAAVDNPTVPTSKLEDFKVGEHNEGVSLPIEYWIEGELVQEIVNGESIRVFRDNRNGVKVLGIFTTSPVIKWDGKIAETLNSKYLVEYV